MTKLIVGCGYLGGRVARRWREVGHDVAVVTRSSRQAAEFGRQGYRATVADVTRPETLTDLPVAETVLYSVGYDRDAGPSIGEVYAGGVRNVLAALPEGVGRFIYVSSTGVYGSADGGWIDEQTTPDPQRDGGRASLAAEQELAAHRLGERGIVLRLGGLYGPGRVPYLDRMRAGEPIPAPQEGHLNLIHVLDAAAAVLAADDVDLARLPELPRVVNVTDGEPVRRADYYGEVARQIGAPPPRFAPPEPGSPRAARAAADRRIRNDRMLAELGVRLAYANYRAGLAAILAVGT